MEKNRGAHIGANDFFFGAIVSRQIGVGIEVMPVKSMRINFSLFYRSFGEWKWQNESFICFHLNVVCARAQKPKHCRNMENWFTEIYDGNCSCMLLCGYVRSKATHSLMVLNLCVSLHCFHEIVDLVSVPLYALCVHSYVYNMQILMEGCANSYAI